MREEAVVGVSCCFLGFYNLLSFYGKNRLYLYNSAIYLAIFLFGLFKLIKFILAKRLLSKQAQAQRSNEAAAASQQKELTLSLKRNSSTVMDVVEDLPLEHLGQISPSSLFSSKLLLACSEKKAKRTESEPKSLSQKLLDDIRGAELKALFEFLRDSQLKSKWKINKIIRIKNSLMSSRFSDYQDRMAAIVPANGNAGPGNTNFLFHATKKNCSSDEEVCSDKDCSFCSIMRSGFLLSCSGKGASTDLRYGRGIYFSPDINKALSYLQSDNNCVIIGKVVMGRPYTPTEKDDHLIMGISDNKYHSIYGTPYQQADLQSPEVCVFKEEACIPAFVLSLC